MSPTSQFYSPKQSDFKTRLNESFKRTSFKTSFGWKAVKVIILGFMLKIVYVNAPDETQ